VVKDSVLLAYLDRKNRGLDIKYTYFLMGLNDVKECECIRGFFVSMHDTIYGYFLAKRVKGNLCFKLYFDFIGWYTIYCFVHPEDGVILGSN